MKDDTQKRPRPLPIYNKNTMWFVRLPHGYQYFHCQTRGRAITTTTTAAALRETSQQQRNAQAGALPMTAAAAAASPSSLVTTPNRGGVNHITTEDEEGDNYIRVAVSPEQYILSISYLGSKPVEIHNLKVLVGLSQTYLNIVQRHNDGLVKDVVQLLRQNWTMAVFYDKFHGFVSELRNKFRQQKDIQLLYDVVLSHVQEHSEHINEATRKTFAVEVSSDTEHMVQFELIKFLHQNKQFLPIYFLPDISTHIF
jgi:hypothetical protein